MWDMWTQLAQKPGSKSLQQTHTHKPVVISCNQVQHIPASHGMAHSDLIAQNSRSAFVSSGWVTLISKQQQKRATLGMFPIFCLHDIPCLSLQYSPFHHFPGFSGDFLYKYLEFLNCKENGQVLQFSTVRLGTRAFCKFISVAYKCCIIALKTWTSHFPMIFLHLALKLVH